jgi:hypothetical protein
MPRGSIARMKYGVTEMHNANIENTCAQLINTCNINSGTDESTVSMSFEKRFKISPNINSHTYM